MLKSKIAILTAIVICLSTPATAHSQVEVLTDVSQRATYVYGESITFRIEASADRVLTSGRLTVQDTHDVILYSGIVEIAPGTDVTASMAIPAADLRLAPVMTLVYHWDFVDENGQEFQAPSESLDYHDTSVPWEWTATTRGQIRVLTDDQYNELAETALDIATNAMIQSRYTLNQSPGETFTIYLYPELVQLASSLRKHSTSVQDWVPIYVIPDEATALITAGTGPDAIDNLERDLPHAIGHLTLSALAGPDAGPIPRWFEEGLAITLSPEDEVLEETLDGVVRDGQLMPLTRLCGDFTTFSTQEAPEAYAQAVSLLDYVNTRYGIAAVRDLGMAYTSGQSCGAGIRATLGLSLADLETQWHNDLLSEAAHTTTEDASLTTWIIVWAISLALALLFIAPQPTSVTRNRRPQINADDDVEP